MSAPHDNFAALRKLLALKRHETPPPGFFHRLPGRIRARIEADREAAPGWLAAWRKWLNLEWGFKPALAGAMLAAAAGLYVAEVVHHPSDAQSGLELSPNYGLAVVPAVVSNASPPLLAEPLTPTWTSATPGSLQPRLNTAPPPGLFRPGAALTVSPAAFNPDGAPSQDSPRPVTVSNRWQQAPPER